MKIVIDIPKEFEEHFNSDRFEDSLARIASDIESFGFQLAGRYEQETITMLRKAIKNSTLLTERLNADYISNYIKQKIDYLENLASIETNEGRWREEEKYLYAISTLEEVVEYIETDGGGKDADSD